MHTKQDKCYTTFKISYIIHTLPHLLCFFLRLYREYVNQAGIKTSGSLQCFQFKHNAYLICLIGMKIYGNYRRRGRSRDNCFKISRRTPLLIKILLHNKSKPIFMGLTNRNEFKYSTLLLVYFVKSKLVFESGNFIL